MDTNAVIDYRKAVDTIDEGLMALNLLRAGNPFPFELRDELIDILNFLSLVEKPEYKSLLYDNRVTISKESLESIHEKIKDIKFSIADIDTAKILLQKTNTKITVAEMDNLEAFLLEFSQPLWVTIILRANHGK